MNYRTLLLAATLLNCLETSFVPCIASEPLASSASQAEPLFIEDITYGIVDGIELKLNLAIPGETAEASSRYPLLIFIHGGGWKTGHRNAYNKRIRLSAERGYVAATLSHRLTAAQDEAGHPRHPWPAAIHDCKAAVRFLKTYADQFHIDPNRIGVTGASSGGHLALLLGLTDAEDGLEGEIEMAVIDGLNSEPATDTSVQAVFNKSGPTELISCYDAPVVKPFLEDLLGRPAEATESYRAASPIVYISENDPPIMTIHGELDHVVPVEQARLLQEHLNAAGIIHRYLELPGEKHVFTSEGGEKYWQSFYAFFDEFLDKE